jgi:hypothetical protein
MPKLQAEHLIERLNKRIEQLKNRDLLAAKDINNLLNKTQRQILNDNWSKQLELRKIHKTPKTEKEKKRINWKTIREVRLEVLEQALAEAQDGLLESFEKRLKKKEIKRAKIYLDTYFENTKNGVDKATASLRSNNELKRHGLRRLDGMRIVNNKLDKRNKEIMEMEEKIKNSDENE